MSELTIVICTHNRADLLKRALDALRLTQETPVDFDVLVVANACSDNTETLLKEYENQWPALRWVSEPTPGKSYALNRAMELIESQTIVFVDDDQRATGNFTVAIQAALNDFPNAGIICGRLLPDWDGSEPSWVHDNGPYRIYPPPVAAYEAGSESRLLDSGDILPPGGNLIIRSYVFKNVGRFATELGPQGHNLVGGEDSEFLHRALDAGESIAYVPNILQYHAILPEQFTVNYLMRKSFHRTRSALSIKPRSKPGIPLYMWKKLTIYALRVIASLAFPERRRFFLVRLASAAGEIQGLREAPIGDSAK